MDHDAIMQLFLGLAILLATARLLGEAARKLNQPTVLGEILAGVLLGPSLLGAIAPELNAELFPRSGPVFIARTGIEQLSVALFLLVAGMEVDLRTVWRQGRTAITVSGLGLVVPAGLGFAAAWWAPELMGRHAGADPFLFALFIGTALGISALPVIARTLLDLDLFRTDIGMIVIASAIVDDVAGWLVFALILSMMGSRKGLPIEVTIGLTLGFTALMLTVVRWTVNRALVLVQAYASWPAGVLGATIAYALLCAAITEWIGLHAIFGTFLAGVTVGASRHLRERTRATIDQFVQSVFAPLFFGGIGLKVDFVSGFDLGLVLVIIGIATLGKLLGCTVGARAAGMDAREALAVGLGMNARGAMEIVLGLLALQYGVIDERLFVALVVMALVTSMMSGPGMQRVLQRRRVVRFADHLFPQAFVPGLGAATPSAAIAELSRVAAAVAGVDAARVADAVLYREGMMPTGLPGGIAVPHARVPGVQRTVVAVGTTPSGGFDFGAPDGTPATLLFLVLTPEDDDGAQTDLIADIGRTFGRPEMRDKALSIRNFTELVALSRTGLAA